METLQIIVLGIVQGITEFLPISSSGHLILLPSIVEWPDQGLLFDIAVHVGTLAAVMLYFHKEVWQMILGVLDMLRLRFQTDAAHLTAMIAVSTIPLVLVAPVVKSFVETGLRSVVVIAVTSILFGLILWYADITAKKCMDDKSKSLRKMRFKDAFIFGLFQTLALIPGTSRSGSCMTAGRFLGFSRSDSSRYAMLMAMPVILMMGGYSFISDFEAGLSLQDNMDEILLGAGISFTCALLAIHGLMKFVEKVGFLPFVIYRVLLGLLLLIFIAL